MESALDVLSRAATMVQDNTNETRLSAKELPTTKWRRDRRMRTSEYHHAAAGAPSHLPPTATSAVSPSTSRILTPQSSPNAAAAMHMGAHIRPLVESTNRSLAGGPLTLSLTPPLPMSRPPPLSPHLYQHQLQQHQHQQLPQTHHAMESPIDMSVTSPTLKHLQQQQLSRASPPPPYREPVPGSTYASALARPSVITQAPPKRDLTEIGPPMLMNRENDNRSNESISMCENVIDEHFRRSLGDDYLALMGKKSPAGAQPPTQTPSPQPQALTMAQHQTMHQSMATSSSPQHHNQQQSPHHHNHHHHLLALQQQHQHALQQHLLEPSDASTPQVSAAALLAPPSLHPLHVPHAHHNAVAPPPPSYHSLGLILPKTAASLLSPAALVAQVKNEPISPTKRGDSRPAPSNDDDDGGYGDVNDDADASVKGRNGTRDGSDNDDVHEHDHNIDTEPEKENAKLETRRGVETRERSQSPLSLAMKPSAKPLSTPCSPLVAPAVSSSSVLSTRTTTTPPPSSLPLPSGTTASSTTTTTNKPAQSPPERSTPSPQIATPLNAAMPAILRIKTEPGLAAAIATTNTPTPTTTPNTPNSNRNTNVLASVDDHFAKALGDTWKKLQKNKDLRK